jgi:ATP-binding cassette subfamily B multidrug efflux pump
VGCAVFPRLIAVPRVPFMSKQRLARRYPLLLRSRHVGRKRIHRCAVTRGFGKSQFSRQPNVFENSILVRLPKLLALRTNHLNHDRLWSHPKLRKHSTHKIFRAAQYTFRAHRHSVSSSRGLCQDCIRVEEEVLGKAYDSRLMRRLLTYMKPYRKLVLGALGCLILYSLLQVCAPILTKIAIDRYLNPDPQAGTWLGPYLSARPYEGLFQISLLYLFVLAGTFVTDFGETYLMQKTGQFAMFDLRRDLMTHLQRLDPAYYDHNPVGRLVTRVTTDVDALNDMFSSGIVTILGDVLTLSFIVIAMLRLSAPLTGLMLAVMPVVVAVTWLFRSIVAVNYRRIRIAVARINSYLNEHIVGIAVLQLFNREEKSELEFHEINRQHMDAYKNTIAAYGWFYPAVEFLSYVSLAAILSYGGFHVSALHAPGDPTLGIVAAFLQFGMRFFRPIQDLSEKYNILQSAMAAADRVFRLLDTPVHIVTPAQPLHLSGAAGAIEFDHVWFAYNDEDWILRDVSFRIEPGETVAIVGHTGAGKTTIVSLVLRFYDVQRGVVRVGGIDVRQLDPTELRRHFGVVLQDPHLFAGSVGENIRLGTENIRDEDVESAAEQVNLTAFIRSLPRGLDEPVHERGASLSTGQKQLIGFARALAHRPRYLILDEATSGVDTETEMRVREALGRLVEGRTAVVIAHRLSTVQKADRIFVMHRGQLRETGTHRKLLGLRGLYWRLYQLQYKDQEIRA